MKGIKNLFCRMPIVKVIIEMNKKRSDNRCWTEAKEIHVYSQSSKEAPIPVEVWLVRWNPRLKLAQTKPPKSEGNQNPLWWNLPQELNKRVQNVVLSKNSYEIISIEEIFKTEKKLQKETQKKGEISYG